MKKNATLYIVSTMLAVLMTVVFAEASSFNRQWLNKHFVMSFPAVACSVLALIFTGVLLAAENVLLEGMGKKLVIRLKLCAAAIWIIAGIVCYFAFYSALAALHLVIVGYSIGGLLFIVKGSNRMRE